MKRLIASGIVLATTFAAGSAMAEGGACTAPMSQWQPSDMLVKKLETAGWQVRRVKTENGCYEAYAIDNNGQRVEAYFDPKTLEPVNIKDND